MALLFSQRRILPAIAAFGVGLAASLLVSTPFGLLAPVAALFILASGRATLLLYFVSAAGLAASLLVAAFYDGATADLAAMWAAFFAQAICIGALVKTGAWGPQGAGAAVRNVGSTEASSYLAVGLNPREKAAPRDSPIVSITAADDHDTAARLIAASFWGGTPFHLRYWRRLTGGNYIWTELRTESIGDPAGTQTWSGIHAAIDEPTPRPQSPTKTAFNPPNDDEAVKAAKVVERLLGNAWAFDAAGRPTYLTPIAQTFVEVTLEEFQAAVDEGHTVFERTSHPDEVDRITAAWRHSLETSTPFHIERRIRRASGIYDWSRTAIVPTHDSQGRVTGWYGASTDLDAYRLAEAELRQREREISQLVDMVPSHLWRLAPDGEPIFFNRRMIDFLGRDVAGADMPGISRLEVFIRTAIHPDDAARFRAALGNCLATGESFASRYRMRRADGLYRWMSSLAEPMRISDGTIAQWYGLSHDIDDEVRLYSDLEEREARIRRLVDSDIIGIVIWDLDGRLIDANDAFLRMVQYDRKDLEEGLRWFDMTPPEWQAAHAQYEAEELRTTGRMQAREKEYFRKDGSRVPVLIGAACFEGQSRQGVAYILDLTERKRAESALRDRERELSQLVDMLPVHIGRLTPEGEPIFFNKRLTDFIGVHPADIGAAGNSRLETAIESFVHPDEAPHVMAALRRAVATGSDYAMRYRMRGADGAYRWIETRAEPLRNRDGTIAQWYSVSIDIEDQMRAQQAEETLRATSEKLAKATQAASLSELSASIAHEVNQPLAAIVANSHACQRWLSEDPANVERAKITVERIMRDANSAADVVSRIRALFKQSMEDKISAALPGIIAEACSLMMEEATRRCVRIDLVADDNLPVVTFDRVQIQQVLINLIRNGIDAMDSVPGDRTLTIRVRRAQGAIRTAITDRGRGVAFPNRIFEPFFTTKEHGMGMGLAICRSIVESHGGRLWVENQERKGATFIFTLPIEEEGMR
jgi:PAS domain S-box-containing protein